MAHKQENANISHDFDVEQQQNVTNNDGTSTTSYAFGSHNRALEALVRLRRSTTRDQQAHRGEGEEAIEVEERDHQSAAASMK
ncbi:hypothetical protein G6F70_000419 [Rhizopus microsporus]|nr:hypothetical protein G6F71_002557 [Rhizopus microsporus]KAG1204468.1 hypothetical protein G6F70_000419 [Rhizopus microsporus]KAG1215824.1 hypothetical protein G6F69_000635 [Rhizopus microsporus]KAG1236282.1 hypothetical protein G6F67_002105 [Rhizopus microsporus]KAG1268220.1 hypothetical protein G6F68_001295 [Rhizopus microsporus]